MTSIEWLLTWMTKHQYFIGNDLLNAFEEAKEMHKQEIIDDIIGFQIYLNDKKLINNHDWDFEKEAKKYYKKK